MKRRYSIAFTSLSFVLFVATLSLWARTLLVEPGSFHIYRPLPPDRPVRTLFLINWRPAGIGIEIGWLIDCEPQHTPQRLRFGADETLWEPYTTPFYNYVDRAQRSWHGFH